MHKFMLFALVTMVVVATVLVILQIWMSFMSWDMFIKVMITLGILILLFGFLMVVGADLGQHKRLKDENYLD